MTNDWLIMKRDLYFRPDCCGYTGIRDHAGRYSLEFARGYEGNGCTIVRADEAPEFTAAAYDDLVIKHLTGQRKALIDLVQTLIDNDPDEPVADNGATVLDVWRDRAKRILAPFVQPEDNCYCGGGEASGHQFGCPESAHPGSELSSQHGVSHDRD